MGTPSDTHLVIDKIQNDQFEVDPEFTIDPSVAKAFIEAQKALRGVKKGTDAQYGKFRGMDDIMKALRGLDMEDSNGILDHNIFPFSYWHEEDGKQYHSMRMLHSSGATGMASTIAIPEEHSLRGGNSMQGLKSDGTYSLRIHLESMFLFFEEDNDGYKKPKEGQVPGDAENRETKDPLPESAKEEDVAEYFKEIQKDIDLQKTPPQLVAWQGRNGTTLAKLKKTHPDLHQSIKLHIEQRASDIKEGKV